MQSPTLQRRMPLQGIIAVRPGFEAVMGYLYLTDQYCRMIDLIKMGLEALKDGK